MSVITEVIEIHASLMTRCRTYIKWTI